MWLVVRELAKFPPSNPYAGTIESLFWGAGSGRPGGRGALAALPRPNDERTVIDRLAAQPFVVVAGMSGIGKSALAAHVANVLRPQFELIVWHDGHDLQDIRQLADLDVRRTGTRHNVASLMRRYPCLVILDDATLPQGQLRSIDYGKSKVVVTCQTSGEPGAITLGDLDPDVGRAVLEADVTVPCPVDLLARVRATVGGHPLLLRALNRIALDEGWAGVAACCPDAVDALEDDRNEKVCRRILTRHAAALSTELEFVRWCNRARMDAELLAVCASRLAAKNLLERGFLAATAPGDVRVHDIVYRSIRAVVEVSPAREQLFRDRLESFWCQRKAQALRSLGKPELALAVINRALGLLDVKDAKFRPAFLRDRCIIRREMSDAGAARDLRAAIADPLVDPKFRAQLEAELAAMTSAVHSSRS